jgi:hypothetical protein
MRRRKPDFPATNLPEAGAFVFAHFTLEVRPIDPQSDFP